ncbi:aminotransferase class III-fold pyridoxal phosphate-dependent enzyme [Micromonospora sp. NPDC002296]|uniref:aspartate aminotransferase family protein n=1 Tax=Micromonospora sp. NPDC002296 TaxID=3154271 RepID=UPI0033325CC7
MRTDRQLLAEAKAAHNHPTYSTMSFVMGCGVQGPGSGAHVGDGAGNRLLALFDQYGNQSFGYSHPRIVEAVADQLATGRLNSTKILFEEEQIRLTSRLAELTGGRLPYSYLANGGGESIDNALKLARAATGRSGFVTAVDCFHGKTLAALSASGRPEHAALFSPFLERFRQVPFNDVAALAAAVDGDTAAVLLEPVQAEGGVIVPDPGYLTEVRRICDEAGALLILDEMQTAFGRCGTFFAHERFGVTPDLVCIGKAFGGGVLPISAVLGSADVWRTLRALPSTFGSSLGGNPLCCRVGSVAVDIATDESFLRGVDAHGKTITARLAALVERHPAVLAAHRGIGMMHGLEFHDESLGGMVLSLLLRHGVTSTYSLYHNRVLRVQPPMVISAADLARGLDVLEMVVAEVDARRPEGVDRPTVPCSPVTRSAVLAASPGRLRALLRRRPHLLDPFALDVDRETGPGLEEEFAGTLGHDRVVWGDLVEPTEEGVDLRAVPDWLWRRLDRSVRVRPVAGDEDRCAVEVRVQWDTGSGAYEPLLAGHLGPFVTDRLHTLLTQLGRRTGAAETTART